MPQQQLLQQQRTARIDQIMKLFPEQNGNLLSSQTQQQLHHINYPLAMECDPTPASTAHIHRSSRYPSMNVMGTNHALIASNAIASINNANNVLHHGSVDHSLSAYQQHHHLLTASGMPNNAITGGIGGGVASGGGGVGSTGGYIPYSMSSDAINVSMPTSNQVQIGSSNKNLSNPSSGSSSSVSGQSGTGAQRSSGTTANDRGDDSPMVGVCVQQSPVVIH